MDKKKSTYTYPAADNVLKVMDPVPFGNNRFMMDSQFPSDREISEILSSHKSGLSKILSTAFSANISSGG